LVLASLRKVAGEIMAHIGKIQHLF